MITRNLFVLVGITTFLLVTNFSPISLVASSSVAQQKDSIEDKIPSSIPPSAQDKDEATIRLGTNLVLLDVTVLDSSNNTAIMHMERDNFQILEDKSPQSIEFFTKEQVPVSVVLTIDTSGSMRLKLDTVVKAAVNLVKQSRCDDEIAVIAFKESPELLENFTHDTRSVIDTLEALVAGNSTSMLDAVYVAADYTGEAKNRRRAMVIVTDGLDRENYYKFDEVVKHVQKSDVQIYFIGFTQDIDESSGGLFAKSPKGKAEALLTKLAAETGGRAFFPRSLLEVETIAQQISTDLRTQYAIGYYSTNGKRDGSFRSVKVKISTADKRRLVARTRSGYYAPLDGTKRTEP